VDADILERWLKRKNKIDRRTIAQQHEIKTVLMYYVDKSDRIEVMKEYDIAIKDAMEKRQFKRCSEMQEYIVFLQNGFSKLQNEKDENSENTEEYLTLTKNSTSSECYPVEHLRQRPSLGDVVPDSNMKSNKLVPTSNTKKHVSMAVMDVLPQVKVKEGFINSTVSKIEHTSSSEIVDVAFSYSKLNEFREKTEDSTEELCELKTTENDDNSEKPEMCFSSRISRSYDSPSVQHLHNYTRGSTPCDLQTTQTTSETISQTEGNGLLASPNSQVNSTILSAETASHQDINVDRNKKENVDMELCVTPSSTAIVE